MKRKLGFIAIGQAGGNIGVLLESKGYNVLYINTSQEDLNTLQGVKRKYHIAGGEGCNKDRLKAKQLVVEDFDNIFTEINKLGADMLFTIFAAGGGTGSGAGPMLTDLLVDEGLDVGTITVLPSEDESIKANFNTYKCLKELTDIEGTGVTFILDNSKGYKMEINRVFVDGFDSFLTIPERHSDTRGNIDKAEIVETLKAHGMALVMNIVSVSKAADVISSIKSNMFATLETDTAIKYITISADTKVNILDIQQAIGQPMDVFRTYNDSECTFCLSGLSYPQTRIDQIGNIVEANSEVIKLSQAKKEVEFKELDLFEEASPKKKDKTTEGKPKNRRDIMSKYLK